MFALDTDTLSQFLFGHERLKQRMAQATEEVASTVINRIEVLQGRFASILKAEDGDKLVLALGRLVETERALVRFTLLPIAAAAAAEFDRLRRNKRLKKIGRADLLIAAIVLANQAKLVTRNLKDFQQVPGLQVENWLD